VDPYESVAHEFEHGRPAYAIDAVAQVVLDLRLRAGSTVLDLGAGTGKLTRMLVCQGLEVTALEPSQEMLARLRKLVPEARTVLSSAEAMPLPAESFDAVTAAQAFHWFDAPAALRAIHGVLRPVGGIALLWNRRDVCDPVQALLDELTNPPDRRAARGWQLDVPAVVEASGLFGPVSAHEFPHVEPTDPEALRSRLRSSSYVAGLPPDGQLGLEHRLEAGLERIGPVTQLAYTTLVYTALRR
jgi:SAM-dependent methyltransferase